MTKDTKSKFRFISSYRGAADYRHLPSGARVRHYVNSGDDSIHWIDAFLNEPADLQAEWREHLAIEAASLQAWAAQRGIDLGAPA
jgi:hypothetical protein